MENVMRIFLVVVISLFLIATVGAWYVGSEQEAKTKMVSCQIVERTLCWEVTIVEICKNKNPPFPLATGSCFSSEGYSDFLKEKVLVTYQKEFPKDFEGVEVKELAEYQIANWQEKT